ncbi:acylneuraminate cytidylyltransferase family protein [Desulfitobacterium hafniense]|uniref:Acylneuraminate cytidylyltransferase n=1 Tax=Desulfitobacterium hafniense (strain Y51) TaxID=138119 RepID=Q24S96_DESHY|nr:acylneuraminate cytidylyltransferase family protein [Desulfitobacterium hafniense]BAE85096.1 hypothetical protein DSY3307 [Desulfitobacterium hafniense Y51]
MKKVAALLPIKENSERVRRKNFRLLCGKPLYQWILETLLSCQRIDCVVIDTDSPRLINELNANYPKVKTILRPENIRGGMVSMNKVIEHDLLICKEYNHFIQTHTTNPLLSKNSIDDAIKCYFEGLSTFDSAFSVNRIQARTYWGDGTAINHTLGELRRTQDLVPIFEENSNFFLFSRQSFAKTKSRLGEKPLLYETSRIESLEIDEEEDFKFVELVLSVLIERSDKCEKR